MVTTRLENGYWSLCAEDAALRQFRNEAFADAGLTFRAYLADVGVGWTLIGSVPESYVPELLGSISAFAAQKPLLYMICHGTQSDAAAVRAVLERYPDTCVVAGHAALFGLHSLGIRPKRTIEIRTDRTLTLGEKCFAFHILPSRTETPCLYAIDRRAKTLFTADVFGAFGVFDEATTSRLSDKDEWIRGARLYREDIGGEARQPVANRAATLIAESGIETVCPAIGPVIDCDMDALLSLYTPAAKSAPARRSLALIHTGGIVASLAARIAEGIESHGENAPRVINLDLSAASRESVLAALRGADVYLFGTDDCEANAAKAIWDIATSLRKGDIRGKRAAVFYAQNASDPVADALRSYLAVRGMKLDLPDWFVAGTPTEKDFKNALDYGFGLGCAVLGIPNPRQPKLVKCLVCGEIFDATLGACPVCGVGLEQCVPVDEEEINYRGDSDRRYLIIGGSAAGVAAAEAIRSRDATGSITLLSAEEHLPIHRPMLTKGVIDEVVAAPENIYIHPAAWYAERSISLCLGVTATAIDPKGKTVTAAGGESYPYDRLILAVGAECFVPPIEGRELDGVLTVRHLRDAEQMVKRMTDCRRAVVIGGGVLGLEAAGELMRSAIPVTVLEAAPQIMWKQIDADSSVYLRERMKKANIDCHEGVSIAAIEGDGRGHVTGVRLADRRVFDADMVIVSCGMKANTRLASEAGIKSGRAIEVDMFMRTSVPDIYACGDCCAYNGVNWQLVQEATAQARVAGAHAAGDRSVCYANRVLGMHIEGVGAAMYAIGDTGKNAELSYKTVETRDEVANRRERYWFARGVLQGAVVINADEKIPFLAHCLENRARHADMFQEG